jgi:dUTPase
MFIRLNKFRDDPIMRHAHTEDAGWDVYAGRTLVFYPGVTKVIALGFGIELPQGTTAFMAPRTSLSEKGLVVHQCPIDAGFMGEIHAIVTNTSRNAVTVDEDTAIAQLVIQHVVQPTWTYGACNHMWDNKKDRAFLPRAYGLRWTGAFGSTNKGLRAIDGENCDMKGYCDGGCTICTCHDEQQ